MCSSCAATGVRHGAPGASRRRLLCSNPYRFLNREREADRNRALTYREPQLPDRQSSGLTTALATVSSLLAEQLLVPTPERSFRVRGQAFDEPAGRLDGVDEAGILTDEQAAVLGVSRRPRCLELG